MDLLPNLPSPPPFFTASGGENDPHILGQGSSFAANIAAAGHISAAAKRNVKIHMSDIDNIDDFCDKK